MDAIPIQHLTKAEQCTADPWLPGCETRLGDRIGVQATSQRRLCDTIALQELHQGIQSQRLRLTS
jgi:hypothetical protein